MNEHKTQAIFSENIFIISFHKKGMVMVVHFYERFLALCKEKGKAPSAVATEIGLNNSSTSYWKKGSIPKGETLSRLAAYFDVPVGYLLDGEGMPDKDAPGVSRPKLALDEAYRVDEIKVEGNGKICVTFDLCDEALTAEEFQNLARFYNRLSKKYDVRPSEVEDIVEMTVKSVSEAAKRLRVEMTVEDNIRDEEE